MLRIQPNPETACSDEAPDHVPLKSVQVDAKLRSFAADVVITQVFRNEEKQPIEAVYCFPIEERAAVYSFVARIGEREIVAQLKEKKEAQAEYSSALQQGHGAYLLEQDEDSQDNFIVNVGALPPSEECTIIIRYVTELEFVQGSNIQFVVPTAIATRYNPSKGGIASPAGTTSKYVQSSPYSIDLRCQIDKMGRSADEYIARINSPSHPIQVDFAQAAFYLITLSQANTHLDRDILINIELSCKRTNSIAAVEPGAVMAVFTPTEEDCRHGLKDEQTNEFIFVVDCSGSMEEENKIGLARQAMLLFLKSLPVDCYFNVIRFGSTHENLFSEVTAVYDESNARKAEQCISQMKADLGGTELVCLSCFIECLTWIVSSLSSSVLSNGSKRIHRVKAELGKSFFSPMEKYRTSPKFSIFAVPWLRRLVSSRLVWDNRQVDRWSKVWLVRPMADSFSFHRVPKWTSTSENNSRKLFNHVSPRFVSNGIWVFHCSVLRPNYHRFTSTIV